MIQVDSAPAETAAAVKCDLASEVLRSFGTLRFAATGWSMLPTIWPGDTLVVERINLDQIQVGEVVLVGRDSRLCAHRLVSQRVKEFAGIAAFTGSLYYASLCYALLCYTR